MGKDYNLIGHAALRLRLPKVFAGKLVFSATDEDLIMSYGEAISFRDQIRRKTNTDPKLQLEYDQICEDLEREVEQTVAARASASSDRPASGGPG